MNDEIKPAGIKGAIRVYKTLYDVDKFVIIPVFPAAVIKAITPYFAMFATAYILDGLLSGMEFRQLLTVALAAAAATF